MLHLKMNTNTINPTQKLSDRSILVCQGRCCRKDGSKKVLIAFQSQTLPTIKIITQHGSAKTPIFQVGDEARHGIFKCREHRLIRRNQVVS